MSPRKRKELRPSNVVGVAGMRIGPGVTTPYGSLSSYSELRGRSHAEAAGRELNYSMESVDGRSVLLWCALVLCCVALICMHTKRTISDVEAGHILGTSHFL